MCDADAVILLRISVVAWPPNTGRDARRETREAHSAQRVWLHSETLLLDCRPIVSPASRPSRRRQINPPEIADSQHGSPAEAKVPGEACREALGNELKHQRTTTQPASTSSPTSTSRPVSHLPSTPPLTVLPIATPPTTTIPPIHPRGKFYFLHQQPHRHRQLHHLSIYSPRAPPKPHPAHTHACLPCQKVAAARQGRQHRPRTLTLENTSISTHATNLRGPCLPPTCHQRRAK